MATSLTEIHQPLTVSHEEWIEARKKLLQKEKEFTRLRDELSRQRRELPRERVEKNYVFNGPRGEETLADLFDGRGQLIVYHFMFAPGWSEGCKSCSYLSDHFDATTIHLAHRDATLAVVSRATWPELAAFKERMGWKFHWVSSYGSDFNFDYKVSVSDADRARGKRTYNYAEIDFMLEELPGLSVFSKDQDGTIYHTYSSYARGLDILVGTYNFLDHAPKGRDEEGLKHPMAWVRHHDKYENNYFVDTNSDYVPPAPAVQAKPAEPLGHSCCSGEHD
ncbi:DUF899 domain-containing protein [Acidobacteria bacterium AB60]|nr:DUF899 domain-containing protein [Acidobacteria bacterium AB60]